MYPQGTTPRRHDEHSVAVDCRVDEHSRSANNTDARHMSEVVGRTPQLSVRLGLSTGDVVSVQGVQQDAVVGKASELLEKLSAFGLRVVARLCNIDDLVDATLRRPHSRRFTSRGSRRGGKRLGRCVNRSEVRRRCQWLSRRPSNWCRTAGGERAHKGRSRNEHHASSRCAPALCAASMFHGLSPRAARNRGVLRVFAYHRHTTLRRLRQVEK
jgi:hypothetical protein